MIGALMVTATLATTRLLPRVGPRPLMTAGMLLAAGGTVMLTGLGVDSSYAAHVLPGLLVEGLGIGLVMSPATNTATLGVDRNDAGVGLAGGERGRGARGERAQQRRADRPADLLHRVHRRRRDSAQVTAAASVHGYTTAFWWAAAIFAVGAVVCAALVPSGAPEIEPSAEPVLVH